ncbi:hypothetical protein EVAR_68265_1 [Eumeta japonica]|uniref:Uncharacterized protein n=1 Tax=Eumeta variegata TaxID=151549 RepID=A0A4C1SFA6_EUMVA|nr:hypothetical protein EVAR_68265_1 [Eumeta japonica]
MVMGGLDRGFPGCGIPMTSASISRSRKMAQLIQVLKIATSSKIRFGGNSLRSRLLTQSGPGAFFDRRTDDLLSAFLISFGRTRSSWLTHLRIPAHRQGALRGVLWK